MIKILINRCHNLLCLKHPKTLLIFGLSICFKDFNCCDTQSYSYLKKDAINSCHCTFYRYHDSTTKYHDRTFRPISSTPTHPPLVLHIEYFATHCTCLKAGLNFIYTFVNRVSLLSLWDMTTSTSPMRSPTKRSAQKHNSSSARVCQKPTTTESICLVYQFQMWVY